MQVSTGALFPSVHAAFAAGVPMDDLVEVRGTRAQVESLSAAVARGRADERKKAARRAAQRSRRSNR